MGVCCTLEAAGVDLKYRRVEGRVICFRNLPLFLAATRHAREINGECERLQVVRSYIAEDKTTKHPFISSRVDEAKER